MRVKANMIFLDAKCNELRRQGQVFEVSAERFAEINGKIPGAIAALGRHEGDDVGGMGDEPDAAVEADEPAENDAERTDLDEMTCEQLREYIASKGGEAPSKAKRAELDAIARGL